MTKTKNFASFSIVMVLIVLMTTLFAFPVSAASGASKSYSAFTSKKITITTNKRGSAHMTFKSTGTGSYQYGAEAPILSLKVYNHKTGATQYYRVTGSRYYNSVTSKLKLNANTTYTVTVSYLYNKNLNWGTYGSGMYRTTGWYNGNWKITATKNLSYSIR